ncbi:MAG: prepilin-type N-terminal cleavage/methylation domain-containing protein [Verrucomicrobiota bacterium]
MIRKRSGFTLIEVVIAVAIFALAAVQLSSAFTYALLARERSVNNDMQYDDIRAVRMQLLLEPTLEDAEDGDTYETLNNGEATWRAEIEPMEVVDLFQVTLFIKFDEPMEEQSSEYSEQLYLLRPTWSESDERSQLLEDKKQQLLNSRDFDSF